MLIFDISARMRLFKRRSEDPSPELVSATSISPDFVLRETKSDIDDVESPTSSQEDGTLPSSSSSSFSARKGNYFLVTNSIYIFISLFNSNSLIYYRGS